MFIRLVNCQVLLYNHSMTKDINISIEDLLSYAPAQKDTLTVGVAVSGGRDSVALLHCLKSLEISENLKNNGNLHIVAINIEHGIRGENSINDSRFVASLCAELDVPLFSFSVDAPAYAKQNGYTLEQAGRFLRYGIFDKILSDGKCDLIALAHHRDDQIETVFMRILRGTGIRGLCGMRKVNGKYIRPLLDYDREDIDNYIKAHALKYVEDESNADTAYTRNFLRQEIGVLKQRYPQMGDAVSRLVESALEADEFIEAQLPEIEVKDCGVYVKTCDCVNKLIAKRLILKAANALGVKQDIEDKHYNLVLGLLSAENGKYLNLTHGLCVHKEGEYLVFTKRGVMNKFDELPFGIGDFSDLGVRVKAIDKARIVFGEYGNTLYLDADKVPDGAVIRARKDGDYIHKFGGGTKSLGDFLTDKKIPLRTRDNLKVVADGNRILAVFGVDISADVRIDADTQRVFALSVIV